MRGTHDDPPRTPRLRVLQGGGEPVQGGGEPVRVPPRRLRRDDEEMPVSITVYGKRAVQLFEEELACVRRDAAGGINEVHDLFFALAMALSDLKMEAGVPLTVATDIVEIDGSRTASIQILHPKTPTRPPRCS